MTKMLPEAVFKNEKIQMRLKDVSEAQREVAECNPKNPIEMMMTVEMLKNAVGCLVHDVFIAGMKFKGEFNDEDDDEDDDE